MKDFLLCALALGAASASVPAVAQTDVVSPYQVVKSAKVGGAGSFDYVFADADGRRLYIPRGDRVAVFDLDTLAPVGEVPDMKGVHGATVDAQVHHGFSSGKPVVMWDTRTLATIKTIDAQGSPDGIFFDSATEHVFVLSHRAPNATVIDSKDGSVVGTIDLGGAPEQSASDGQGRLYFNLEDKDQVAVVNAKTLAVTARYDLGGKGGRPTGLALDARHRVLFVCCRKPQTCVVLNADDGRILATLPIGAGTDGALFNPATEEAFSSQGDGTLTIIKETSPTSFEVEQTVATKPGAKTCTLDAKTNQVLLITADYAPPPAPSAAGQPEGKRKGSRGQMVPGSFTILVVGR